MTSKCRGKTKAKAEQKLDPGSGEARPVLSLSKGRDDEAGEDALRHREGSRANRVHAFVRMTGNAFARPTSNDNIDTRTVILGANNKNPSHP